jgi:hypothetical protein
MWCFPCRVGAEPVLCCRTTLVLDRGARGILGRGPDTLTSPLLKSPAVDESNGSVSLLLLYCWADPATSKMKEQWREAEVHGVK